MISYEPLWRTMSEKKVTTYTLREKHHISPSILTRIKSNGYLTLRTVEDFCRILDCEIGDIVKYVKD